MQEFNEWRRRKRGDREWDLQTEDDDNWKREFAKNSDPEEWDDWDEEDEEYEDYDPEEDDFDL